MLHQKQRTAVMAAIAIGLTLHPDLGRAQAQTSEARCRDNRCVAHGKPDRHDKNDKHRHDKKDDNKKLKDGIALGLFGLAVGAIVAGAASNEPGPTEVGARRRWHARCSARHPSFDYRTGTFIGRDGRRYPCRF